MGDRTMPDKEYRPPGGGRIYGLAQTLLLILFAAAVLFVFLYPGQAPFSGPLEPANSDYAE